MKKYINFCASLLAVAALSACSDTYIPGFAGDGEGRVMLTAKVNSDVKVVSRAGETNDELAAKTKIWISNSRGQVQKKYNSFNEVPATGIMLASGQYVAEAWAGDSVSASFDKRYFKGRSEFSITKNSTTQVEIACKIANSVVSVEFQDEVKALLDNITLEVGHDKSTHTRDGSLTFTPETSAATKGYYMANSRSKELVCTLKGNLASNGSEFTFESRIPDIKPATEYHIVVKHNDQAEDPVGGAWITIEVDASEVEVADEITVTAGPAVRGINFDIAQPVSGTVGNLPRTSLWIASTAALASVEVSGQVFANVAGLSGTDFNCLGMTEQVRQTLDNAGINFQLFTHDENDFQEMKINFEPQFLNSLNEGDYSVTVVATDVNGRTGRAVLRLMPTNAKVILAEIDPLSPSITSRSAVLTGNILLDDATNCGAQYRVKGTQQWTKVPADAASRAAGDIFTVTLTGLQASTTYEAAAYCDDFESTAIREFTTDGEPQLPNASFEQWCTTGSKNTQVPSADYGDNLFWDSGNHGSITMNKNVTTADTQYAHDGTTSIKLSSQFVGIGSIGKFAAGNVFVGKYLKTDGTDGVLGWGRPFAGRPTAMKVWARYEPATVNYADNANSDGVQKGDQDRGIIYIALVDDSKTEFEGSSWPFVVKTKSSQRTLFDKNGSQVIAYGEHVFEGAPTADGLIEVTIPIDYRRNDVRPTNIILVASASKMGDYFTGGPSTLWLDDIQLIYGE